MHGNMDVAETLIGTSYNRSHTPMADLGSPRLVGLLLITSKRSIVRQSPISTGEGASANFSSPRFSPPPPSFADDRLPHPSKRPRARTWACIRSHSTPAPLSWGSGVMGTIGRFHRIEAAPEGMKHSGTSSSANEAVICFNSMPYGICSLKASQWIIATPTRMVCSVGAGRATDAQSGQIGRSDLPVRQDRLYSSTQIVRTCSDR